MVGRYRTEGANERKSGYDDFQSEGTHTSRWDTKALAPYRSFPFAWWPVESSSVWKGKAEGLVIPLAPSDDRPMSKWHTAQPPPPLASLRKHTDVRACTRSKNGCPPTYPHIDVPSVRGMCIKINNILRFPRAPKTKENVARGEGGGLWPCRQKMESISWSFVIAR